MTSENIDQIKVFFCPECQNTLRKNFINFTELYCVFYSLDDKELINTIQENAENKTITIKIYYKNYESFLKKNIETKIEPLPVFSYGLMHNKFCIIDNKTVITGSLNPTLTGYSQYNDVIIIDSEEIAKIYLSEFTEIGNQNQKRISFFKINSKLKEPTEQEFITVLFCPEDFCRENILKIIENSEQRILFSQYVFTDDEIAEAVLKKSKEINKTQGIISSSMQNAIGSEYEKLKEFTEIKKNVHTKLFIIDDYVITGSANPSEAGLEKNDENIIIIKNKQISNLYEQYFYKILNET